MDYPERSRDRPFDSMCLWEHEEWVTKSSAASEEKRLERAEKEEARRTAAEYDRDNDHRKCRTAEPRGALASDHPQVLTHVARLCRTAVVNVVLGETIPRPDRGPKDKEQWARAMLIFFKPWRRVQDLREPNESWTTAFENTNFSENALQVMENMQVEHECKDARDAYDSLRKAGKAKPLLPGNDGGKTLQQMWSHLPPHWKEIQDSKMLYQTMSWESLRRTRTQAIEKAVLLVLDRTQLWRDKHRTCTWTPSEEHTFITTDIAKSRIAQVSEQMGLLAKDKRPLLKPPSGQPPAKRRRLNLPGEREPVTSLEQLNFEEHTIYQRDSEIDTMTPEQHLQDIIHDFGIADNPEQLRALRIIAEHFIFGMEEQLLMYIAGVGGAGKSFVIRAVVEILS
ncbi:hypothetical protein B0H14DRAFT_2576705 [Mycena olivaceomarginata]|nr:hypothetical protein B0H14DRAFT_2576705 [Mycena olivaceomarginata]